MSIMKKAMTLLAMMIIATDCLRAEEPGKAEEGVDKKLEVATEKLGKDWEVPAEKGRFHVFLLMGQSNMAGGIPGKELTEEDKTFVPHIVLRRGTGWIPAAHPLHLGGKKNGFGLGLPFAKEYLANHPGVMVGLVPCASGGKRIDLLKKGSNL